MAGAAGAAIAQPTRATAALPDLPSGRWTLIHEQKPDDAVAFTRQAHGGCAFDSRRGRLVLFGSDSHGLDWTNSPLIFDPASLTWQRSYPNDDPATYSVDERGLPVAGPEGDHPWAMHSFGAVAYDPTDDSLIVASYPKHMVPGRFTDALAHLWPRVRRHPTWLFHLAEQRWRPLEAPAEHFFPYCTAYDSDRAQLIGYRRDGVFALSGQPRRWRRLAGEGLTNYHNNAAYDSRHGALVVFGSVENSDAIVVFEPDSGRHQRMPTPGLRPPKGQHAPMAFHPGLGETVVLLDRHDDPAGGAETWSYGLGQDRWTAHPDAALPVSLGMNYTMAYDPGRALLLLVTGRDSEPTRVWALDL